MSSCLDRGFQLERRLNPIRRNHGKGQSNREPLRQHVPLILIAGHPKMAWSLSALTVLIYYATANLCALQQPPEERHIPRIVSVAGLGGCASLVAFVPRSFWGLAVGLIVAGLIWHFVAKRLAARKQS